MQMQQHMSPGSHKTSGNLAASVQGVQAAKVNGYTFKCSPCIFVKRQRHVMPRLSGYQVRNEPERQITLHVFALSAHFLPTSQLLTQNSSRTSRSKLAASSSNWQSLHALSNLAALLYQTRCHISRELEEASAGAPKFALQPFTILIHSVC